MDLFLLIPGVVFGLFTLLIFVSLASGGSKHNELWDLFVMTMCATISVACFYFFWIG